jgi:hypothetical protein
MDVEASTLSATIDGHNPQVNDNKPFPDIYPVKEEVNQFDLLITPSKRQQLLFDGPSKQYWDLPMLQSEFVHSKRLEETYKEWSQIIYTARLEFSIYSKEKCDKDAAHWAETEKEAQSKPKSITPLDKQHDSSIERPKSPPERTIPRYVELGESLLVSPLKQHDTLTSFGDEMYRQDLQRLSAIDYYQNDRSRAAKDDISVHTAETNLSLSQDLYNEVLLDDERVRSGVLELGVTNPVTRQPKRNSLPWIIINTTYRFYLVKSVLRRMIISFQL